MARERLAQGGGDRRGPGRRGRSLRDELGRRVDCARGREPLRPGPRLLARSDQAFGAFIRELPGRSRVRPGLHRARRRGPAEVMAVVGRGTDRVFPPGLGASGEGLGARGGARRQAGLPVVDRSRPSIRRRRSSCARVCEAASSHRCRSARARSACSASSARSASLHAAEARARRAARAPGRHRCAEHSRRTRPNAAPRTSFGDSPRSVRISSRSCRTSCAARWLLSSVPRRRCRVGGGS